MCAPGESDQHFVFEPFTSNVPFPGVSFRELRELSSSILADSDTGSQSDPLSTSIFARKKVFSFGVESSVSRRQLLKNFASDHSLADITKGLPERSDGLFLIVHNIRAYNYS